LKNQDAYASVSAFSPICNPTACPWGVKAFTGYLGSVEAGKEYDAVELLGKCRGGGFKLLVDQGGADNFLVGEVRQIQTSLLLSIRSEADADTGRGA
jgi:S-formylglutathione hydrolase FrmB